MVYDDERDRYLNLVLSEADEILFEPYRREWDLFEREPRHNEIPALPVEGHLTPLPRLCRTQAMADACAA